MPNYTLSELIEKMEPQHRRNQALIRKCIDSLTVYAAQQAQKDPDSPKVAEIRNLVENLAGYWGLEDGQPEILQKEYLDPFDARIEAAKSDTVATETRQQCANAIYGLHIYGSDILVSIGDLAKDEILFISKLMEEIGEAWDFESQALDDLTSWLEMQANSLDDTSQMPEPGMEMQ